MAATNAEETEKKLGVEARSGELEASHASAAAAFESTKKWHGISMNYAHNINSVFHFLPRKKKIPFS
jgi:hypothetical protein